MLLARNTGNYNLNFLTVPYLQVNLEFVYDAAQQKGHGCGLS